MTNTNKLIKSNLKPSSFAYAYVDRLNLLFKKIDSNKIDDLFLKLDKTRKKKRKIFLAGNGGSSSTAAHMQNDLNFDVLKRSNTKIPFKFFNLSDNSPSITAISNDIKYEDIFSKQIEIFGDRQDMLILLSASGNSKNLINAANLANKKGIYTYGFLGFDGGKLKKICRDFILFPSDKLEYGLVEDAHLILNHVISHWFQVKLKN